jgi:hypothetical protein
MGIVATQGEAGESKVQGDIHAELSIARRLVTIGGLGAADFTSSKYQGLLQQDFRRHSKTFENANSAFLRSCKRSFCQGLPRSQDRAVRLQI